MFSGVFIGLKGKRKGVWEENCCEGRCCGRCLEIEIRFGLFILIIVNRLSVCFLFFFDDGK